MNKVINHFCLTLFLFPSQADFFCSLCVQSHYQEILRSLSGINLRSLLRWSLFVLARFSISVARTRPEANDQVREELLSILFMFFRNIHFMRGSLISEIIPGSRKKGKFECGLTLFSTDESIQYTCSLKFSQHKIPFKFSKYDLILH
jgi:hypothetical protein